MGLKISDRHVNDSIWWVICRRCGWKTDEPNTAVSYCPECVRYGMSRWEAGLNIVSGKTLEEVKAELEKPKTPFGV
jgi:hypothetical protein